MVVGLRRAHRARARERGVPHPAAARARARVPQAQFAPGLFAESRTPCLQATTRDPSDLVRLLAAVPLPVLAPPAARPHGASKRRGGEDDDEGEDGYTGEGAFVPL